jgi:hypothetical protein
MLYQLSHVRVPVPSRPGPVRRIAPALRQNCIRSWPNHQLRTEGKAKNLYLERTRLTPPPPFLQVSRPSPTPAAPETPRDPRHARHPPTAPGSCHRRHRPSLGVHARSPTRRLTIEAEDAIEKRVATVGRARPSQRLRRRPTPAPGSPGRPASAASFLSVLTIFHLLIGSDHFYARIVRIFWSELIRRRIDVVRTDR